MSFKLELTTNFQQWMLRAGTALAYTAKIFFALSIGSAMTQHLWQLMRSGPFSLGAIDNLFDLKNHPLRIFKSELLAKAKISILLAASIWYSKSGVFFVFFL